MHWQPSLITPYVNTIPLEAQPPFPGDLAMEQRLAALMRWNALAMVMRANRVESGGSAELGGHIASYASAADLFEVGFNHFFRARDDAGQSNLGDLVFFQPHSAPGVYARAFLEGRLCADDLAHYRQELVAPAHGARGLTSYPHPQLMPDFWQFPTGSMGIGPINAIYQARFMRYLQHRGLLAGRRAARRSAVSGASSATARWTSPSRSPRSRSPRASSSTTAPSSSTATCSASTGRCAATAASSTSSSRCSPAPAGTSSSACGARDWDVLFARDHGHALMRAFAHTVDGQFQTLSAKDGAFNREVFFGQNDELKALVADLRDEDIDRLRRGGHDAVKIHAAFAAAVAHAGQPTVVLAKTMKGYAMGEAAQGRMTTHQAKKLDSAGLLAFRDRFALPMSDADTAVARVLQAGRRQRRDALPAEPPPRARRRRCRRGAATARRCAVPALDATAGVRAPRRRQGDEHDDGVRAHPRQPAEGPGARPARRADRRRRGAHLRHGEPVPPGRHLRAASASSTSPRTRARSSRTARTRAARSSRKASPRRARSRRGRRRRRRTRRTAWRCCRSTSTTRCSASSASAT